MKINRLGDIREKERRSLGHHGLETQAEEGRQSSLTGGKKKGAGDVWEEQSGACRAQEGLRDLRAQAAGNWSTRSTCADISRPLIGELGCQRPSF